MLKCAATNVAYMRASPAGQQGYGALVKLYQSIAGASLNCAREWADDNSCPPHQPAVDAFWWAVAVWAVRFTTDVVGWAAPPREGLLLQEVQEVFTRPHIEFANWLRPVLQKDRVSAYPFVTAWPPNPGLMILAHDIAWTWKTIRLTARWGLGAHLKELPAFGQALLLMRRLKRGPRDPVANAFLGSDLVFFRRLFRHFDFSPELRGVLDRFLAAADVQTGQD